MQKTITLIGEFRSNNLGDAVIFFVFSSLLKQKFSKKIINIDISDYRNSPSKPASLIRSLEKYFPNIYKKIAYPYMRLYSLIKIPKQSEVCFVGGALFQNYFIDSMRAILKTARQKQNHITFFSIGLGPLSIQNENYLKNFFQNNCHTKLTIRDGTHFWKKNNIPFLFQPDVAICSSLVYGHNDKIATKHKKIGIGIISLQTFLEKNPTIRMRKKDFHTGLCNIITSAQKLGYQIELFCNGDIRDFNTLCEIKSFFPESTVLCAQRPQNHYNLIETIRKYEFVIASRLHAIIIAYSYQIPFFALGWDPKVMYFLRKINMSDSGIPLQGINKINWDFILKECFSKKIDKKNLFDIQHQIIDTINSIPT